MTLSATSYALPNDLSPVPGDVVLVFDATAWGGHDRGDNSEFWKPATILSIGRTDAPWRELVATVRFTIVAARAQGIS
jgi:hypothetical protein